jgi:hypothetical protein
MRLVLLIAIVVTALVAALALPASATQPAPVPTETTISGGSLLHSVRLAPADQAAFLRRLDLPPLLDDAPEVSGPSYTVTSPYWDQAIRAGDNTQVLVDNDATYYPEGGFVRTRQAGEEIWTALDHEQRAILDRYITVAGSVPAEPSVFEVMREAGLKGEDIGITVGRIVLTEDQRAKFWENAKGLAPLPPGRLSTPTAAERAQAGGARQSPTLAFLVFTLPEGRGVSMVYSNVTGVFSELQDGVLGVVIPVPRDWLVPVLGDAARFNPNSNGLAPQQIIEDETDGSPLWWPITLGGGAISIAIAIVLQRKFRSLRSTHSS